MDPTFSILIAFIQKQHIRLSVSDIDQITSILQCEFLSKKEFLLKEVKEGTSSRYKYFVTKGCLKVFVVDDKGGEKIIHFALENEWVEDIGGFTSQRPSRFNIQALEDTEVIKMSYDDLERLYKAVPQMEHFFRISYQKSFINLQYRMLDMMSKSGEERYLGFIKTHPTIEQRIPQYMVAAHLGLTPVFLSMVRKKKGLINKK